MDILINIISDTILFLSVIIIFGMKYNRLSINVLPSVGLPQRTLVTR